MPYDNAAFQLTPSRRATDFYFTHGILLSFQLTPSRRATGHLCHGLQRHGISTHALTEGDNTALSGCTEEERFQLTPSRRATFSRMCLNQPIHISTHALTEGDCSRSGHLIFPEIFQLTPSRRATVTGRCLRLSASYFNSRPHGGRRDSDRIKDVFAYISTHALTEGDRKLHSSLPGRRNFNSRPHGGRLCPCFHQIPGRYFNSRPHGGRLMPTLSLTFFFYFNSRPHGGRQDAVIMCAGSRSISTHALTEGDKREPTKQQKENISTHALTEGDPAIRNHLHFTRISTHALTEGDYDCFFCGILRAISTHALTEGDSVRLSTSAPRSISTHALTEGDDFKTTSNRLSHIFQLTPSRRATSSFCRIGKMPKISTHALTEGDSKFRQIFLLNRGYAYSISLYFLPHFISLLPQILSFQQKPFKFQVRIFLLFSVHLAFALQNQCVHHVKSRFCTNMFYFVFVLFTQIVKSQTISLFIYDFF